MPCPLSLPPRPGGGAASPSPSYRCARDSMLGALGTTSSKWSPEGNPTTPCHSFEGPLGDTMGLRDSWEPHGCQKLKVTGWPCRTSDNRSGHQSRAGRPCPFLVGRGTWRPGPGSPGLTPRVQQLSTAEGRAGPSQPTSEGPYRGGAPAAPVRAGVARTGAFILNS